MFRKITDILTVPKEISNNSNKTRLATIEHTEMKNTRKPLSIYYAISFRTINGNVSGDLSIYNRTNANLGIKLSTWNT